MASETVAMTLNKALAVNSQNVAFVYPDIRNVEPTEDGNHGAGLGGSRSPHQLLIVPYCAGGPNSEFVMRVYGWWLHGSFNPLGTAPNPKSNVWLPLLLAELYCVAGPRNGIAQGLIHDDEHFAKTITLASGSVGRYGEIFSGGDIGYVKLDLQGPQKFKFDFRIGNTNPGFGNALWSKTSPL